MSAINRVQRVPRIRVAVEAQQAMNRARFMADYFLEAFGGLAGGRGQHDLQFQSLGDAGDGRYRVSLAATGAAGHQRDGEVERVPDCIALLGIQFAALSIEKMLYLSDSVRAAPTGGLQDFGEFRLHPVNLRIGNYQPLERLRNKQPLGNQGFEMPLDHLAAVERVHHQQRVGAVKQIFEFHPAVAIIERGQHAVVKPRANPRWQILRRSHLAGDLVDPFEADSR